MTASTPLMEAGIDSLAATELSSRLRAATGLALSPTLVFEQPTPRAIAAHVLEQLVDVRMPLGVPPAAQQRVQYAINRRGNRDMCMPELGHHVSAATCARIHNKPLHAWCPLVASHPPRVHSHILSTLPDGLRHVYSSCTGNQLRLSSSRRSWRIEDGFTTSLCSSSSRTGHTPWMRGQTSPFLRRWA